MLQLIIFKSHEEPWQAEDKSRDPSYWSDKGEKNRDGGKDARRLWVVYVYIITPCNTDFTT